MRSTLAVTRRGALFALAAFFVATLSGVAGATTVLLLSREELVGRSDMVARVQVGAATTGLSDDGKAIVTRTELRVTQGLKGGAAGTLVLEQIGGTWRGKTQRILGDATLVAGQDAVVFLKKGDQGRVHLTAMALSVYQVDGKGMARRDLRDLGFAKRESGRIVPTDAPNDAPEPVERLVADVLRIAGGK
ncbi:MAG: hypothetical protein WKG00_11570 [Polyangiaceae bacterium]